MKNGLMYSLFDIESDDGDPNSTQAKLANEVDSVMKTREIRNSIRSSDMIKAINATINRVRSSE